MAKAQELQILDDCAVCDVFRNLHLPTTTNDDIAKAIDRLLPRVPMGEWLNEIHSNLLNRRISTLKMGND